MSNFPALESGDKRQIRLVKPGFLLAGLNPVSTDAVAAAAMGIDPMADRVKAPFEDCDSMLKVAEEAGIGTRDLSKIEMQNSLSVTRSGTATAHSFQFLPLKMPFII